MMSTRNPKVIFLCLEFLEVAANACELNFQSQVASKDFMSVLNALINREIDKTVHSLIDFVFIIIIGP